MEEDSLKRFASSAISELHGSLSRLALMKQTPELTSGRYYAFLLPLIEERESGSEIWAISTMMAVEWTDDPYESSFLAANIQAADRGVAVERIFVVPEACIEDLSNNAAVLAQARHETMSTLLVVRERLNESDPRLLARIGPGILAFDDELVLVDRHNNEGLARGYATYMPEEVASWHETYLELRAHAQKLIL